MERNLLVHNIGHHDLFLVVEQGGAERVLARPRSHHLRSISERVVRHLEEHGLDAHGWLESGIAELNRPLELALPGKKLRDGLEWSKTASESLSAARVVALYTPTLPAVLSAWISRRGEGDLSPTTQPDESEHRLLLVCTDPDAKEIAGTSSRAVSTILHAIVHASLPALQVETLPAHRGNPFYYKTLVPFARDVLAPRVAELRRDVVDARGGAWTKHFHLTLSVSSGTPAMISAIETATRHHTPDVLHVPDARRSAALGVLRSVEHYNFDEREFAPARAVEELGDHEEPVRELVEEMKAWRDRFLDCWPYGGDAEATRAESKAQPMPCEGELEGFWLRKGRKPVLAVLRVERPGEAARHIRASNLEVSLPTGTLCAERNAIGSALAAEPGLRRADLKMVAVLGLPNPGGENLNPLAPCGACREWLLKIAEVNPDFSVVTFSDHRCKRLHVRQVSQAEPRRLDDLN